MKIVNYNYPQSSFLSIEKDLDIIIDLFLKNERLKKLLYYVTPDALDKKNLTEEQTFELFSKNIKIVPQIIVEREQKVYIIITFDNFLPNGTNPEFRDNTISFDIFCSLDLWNLKGNSLRPLKIAAEIDSMLANKRLTGIGKIEFVGADQFFVDDNYAGFSLIYNIIHGEEDKKNVENPAEDQDIEINFDQIFNQ